MDVSFLNEIDGETIIDKLNTLKEFIKNMELLLQDDKFIKLKSDRWSQGKISSNKVNGLCNNVSISPTCGCCSDAPIEAYPYVEMYGFKIFSTESFTIGDQCYCGGVRAWNQWDKNLKDAGMPKKIIDIIQQFFDDNPEEGEGDL